MYIIRGNKVHFSIVYRASHGIASKETCVDILQENRAGRRTVRYP
jgi:hypothetical protein